MQRIWMVAMGVAATATLSGCSFEGSQGAGAPDAMTDGPGQLPGARITCEGFTAVPTHSHYLLINESIPHAAAVTRCKDFPGAHLATFEEAIEPGAVARALSLVNPVWTHVVQLPSSAAPDAGWVNRLDDATTSPIPTGFTWRLGEPNDYDLPEDNEENYGEMVPDVTLGALFDDAPADRPSRVLCECVPTPPR